MFEPEHVKIQEGYSLLKQQAQGYGHQRLSNAVQFTPDTPKKGEPLLMLYKVNVSK